MRQTHEVWIETSPYQFEKVGLLQEGEEQCAGEVWGDLIFPSMGMTYLEVGRRQVFFLRRDGTGEVRLAYYLISYSASHVVDATGVVVARARRDAADAGASR